MKVHIEVDEWYPVYSIVERDRYVTTIEADAKTVQRWRDAETVFATAQDEIAELVKLAEEGDK